MKFTKIFPALSLAAITALLAIAIPASPALAATKTIDLENDEGEIGQDIDIDGEGWPPSDPSAEPPFYKYLDIYFAADEASTGQDIGADVKTYELVKEKIQVDTAGDFSSSFEVPEELKDGSRDDDVRGGTYYVYVTYWDDEDIKADAEFTVIAGKIADFDPDKGPVGTEVDISGEDFGEDEEITIEYDGHDLDIESGDDTTNSRGDFDCKIIIPESTAGDHTITITDESISEVETTFTVEPEITASTTLAAADDIVEITGTGFGGEVDVDITFDGDDVTTVPSSPETDEDGNFTASLTVPDVEEGTYDITAEDDDGNDAEIEFTVEIGTEVTINPVTSQAAPGHVGMNVTVSGVDFQPNSTVTITYTTEPIIVATSTTNAEGSFTATFPIPESEAGEHTITASDGTNALQVPFTMESQAPPIPEPSLPEDGTQAAALAQFDWGGVTDDSPPVTYTLQIATDEDFTSIVHEAEGIDDSEYTVPEAEKLESTPEEEPYYWRVKAIDWASNESGWSDSMTFYVGSSLFSLSGRSWLIHLWWGLGALAAGFLGYYVGKRRAYYY